MFSTPVPLAGLLLFSNMSEETASSPEISTNPEPESAPRVRRVSTPRPKKVAKAAPAEEPAAEIPSIPFPTSSAPDRDDDDSDAPSQAGGEWPEPESESAGGSQSPSEGGPKRKRRRRKGKGQSAGPQNGGGPATEEVYTIAVQEPVKSAEAPQPRPTPQPHQPQRPKVDPELLTKMAWKIYLAEVSEEGVALIGDSDAKDLSRRCFRLAEIFIEEQARRR
jgi:hypothetical protein